MKFCSQCGARLTDESRFCPDCGCASVRYTGPAAASASYYPPKSPIEGKPVTSYLRQAFTAPLFLTFAIMYSAFLAINIFVAMDPLEMLAGDEISEILYLLSGAEKLEAAFSSILMFGQIPNILIVIGIWITYASAKNSPSGPSAGGVDLIKGLCKVLRVLFPIVCGLVSIAILGACSDISQTVREYSNSSSVQKAAAEAKGMLAGVFFGMWVAAGFVIYFYGKLIDSLESISFSITSKKASSNISQLVIVMFIIAGGLSVIGAFGLGGMFLLSSILGGASQIMAAVILASLKDNLRRVTRTIFMRFYPRFCIKITRF